MTETSQVELAMAGRGRIEWAGRSMPALDTVVRRLAAQNAVKGLRIGVSLVLEPKTANLCIGLQDAEVCGLWLQHQ